MAEEKNNEETKNKNNNNNNNNKKIIIIINWPSLLLLYNRFGFDSFPRIDFFLF
jgi:hypothetical protein